MQALEQDAIGMAFVTTPDGILVGVVTDGDIRRALLGGATLEGSIAPFATRNYQSVGSDMGRSDVLDLMQAHRVKQIPIIDEHHHLVGVHLLHEILGCNVRANWAGILAGGKGTRLKPLTTRVPKPMIPIAGRPILERIVLHLVSFGVQQIFLSVNYLQEQIKEHFGDGSRHGCNIRYLEESGDEPLGSGGSLALLPEAPSEPILVINGDLVTQVDISAIFQFHESGGYYTTMGVRPYIEKIPFGCVTVKDDRVVSVEEKPQFVHSINAGVYVLSPEAVAAVPQKFFPITELFTQALETGKPVGGFEIEGDWTDIGSVGDLARASGIGT